ncbi:MAG: type IV pilus assembly protein PilM [Candidatus Shapirobacteria bacterium]
MSSYVGIDLGMGSIKIVSLSKDMDKVVLNNIGEVKTPQITKITDLAPVLKSLLKEMKLEGSDIVVSLPENKIVSRLVSLPPLKESEIKDALRFEAETFVPFPLDEVSIDYEVVSTDDAGRLSVFAIAARNDLVAEYVKLFKSCGIELSAIEPTSLSLKRLVNQISTETKSTMILDIGEKFSDIICMHESNIFFARSLSIGGESITRAISVNLGLDMASAEEYKKAYGMKEMELEGKIKNSIMPIFESLAEEVRRAIALYVESHNKTVDLLIMSGGGAKMPGLAEELTKKLGIEVQVMQPFLRIETTRIVVPVDLNLDGYRFSVAVGCALRGIT